MDYFNIYLEFLFLKTYLPEHNGNMKQIRRRWNNCIHQTDTKKCPENSKNVGKCKRA
jgi:hypothetical protein